MRIEELSSLESIEAVRGPWRELADASSHDTPYVLPEFLLPWLRRLGDRVQCRFLLAWDGERLDGFAPMVEHRVRRFGLTLVHLLGFPDAPPTPPCDILVRPGRERAVELFFEHWTTSPAWDALEFPVVPVESSAGARLESLAIEGGWAVSADESLRTYYVPMDVSWDAYHASRTKKMRQNLRRGLRHFERLGQVDFASYPGALSYEQARDAIFSVLATSWKDHEEGASGWNSFLRDLLSELRSSAILEVSILRVDGLPIAYLVEVPYKGVRYAVHNGYDLGHHLGNPGQLMLAHAIEGAHLRGEPRYDFTGTKDYLHRWTDTQRAFRRIRVTAPSRLSSWKLMAYDRIHDRRVREVHEGTDRTKEARKQARKGEDETEENGDVQQ